MSDMVRTMTPDAVVTGIEANIRGLMAEQRHLPGAAITDSPEMLRFITGIPFPLFNGITDAHLAEDSADTAIVAALAPFRVRCLPMMWWVGPSSEPTNLGERLAAHGLLRVGEMPGMALDLASLAEQPARPDGLTIEPVRDEAILRDYAAVLVTGFGMPAIAGETFFDLCKQSGFNDDAPLQNYLARQHGVPVATAMLALLGGVAGVWNVTTVPDARRQGIGAAITHAALIDGRAHGYHVAILLSSPQGLHVYKRIGFRTYCAVSQHILLPT